MTRTLILAIWVVLAVAFVACELLAILTHHRYAGIRGLLAEIARNGGTVRFVALYIGWMWVGWHFFAR